MGHFLDGAEPLGLELAGAPVCFCPLLVSVKRAICPYSSVIRGPAFADDSGTLGILFSSFVHFLDGAEPLGPELAGAPVCFCSQEGDLPIFFCNQGPSVCR